ncbi:substrate-binding domain-containing protein [Pseudobacteroides cellulosolvens]|uniref:PBP domain containing protein n=1 Tax=Pseudobacteroides cellulosolvens ATCC 35603 = DSM 2933 TaxID=398512 RepID=A0A0L6JPK7_9FIRM|nr:substrate-binding domain-containing protein [Pseudobacteroides cellulosolvens]KNY27650.1 PBP domain containing protein [Pseudobacteroides cellulosolvens ATCC 35603 = DSM 2933]
MLKFKRAVNLLIAATVLTGSFIIPSVQANAAATPLKVGGSTTIAPLARTLETGFEASTGNAVDVVITEGGSGAGLSGVLDGSLDVGMMSRDLSDSEKATYPYIIPITIGKDAVAVIVNPSNPITNLTQDQVKNIFSSAATSPITNWSQLGGNNAPIEVHTRTEGSGTLDAFKELALGKTTIVSTAINHPSSEEMQVSVKDNANAIGFVSLDYVNETVKSTKIDNIECSVINAKNSVYPYVRPLNYITKREAVGNALKWIYYNLGKDAQALIESKKYIRVNDDTLNVVVNSEIQQTVKDVAGELDDGISLTISVTTGDNSSICTAVNNEQAECGIIKGDLDSSWAGLAGRAVAQDSTGTKFTFVTKKFGKVDAIGAAEVLRYVIRNPRGQKIVVKNGLFRVWKFGDVTGDGLVNAADYSNLRSYLLKKVVSLPATAWLFSADVSGDNLINAGDYSILQSYLLKKTTQYPTMQAENKYLPYYPPMP